jgi:hypothetical protein
VPVTDLNYGVFRCYYILGFFSNFGSLKVFKLVFVVFLGFFEVFIIIRNFEFFFFSSQVLVAVCVVQKAATAAHDRRIFVLL